MVSEKFPFFKLPTLIQHDALRFCKAQDILNLSFCSRRHEEAIKEVRIPIKVNVTFWALQVIFFGKSSKTWTFREVENGFNNYTFRSILDASDWNFEDDWSDLTSETPDPKLALSIVFKKFKTLFSFTGVIKFEMNISERDLAADPILREVSECQKLTVNICTEVTEDQLDFLFDQVKVQDSIEIEILKSMGKYEYSKPLSTAKTIHFGAVYNRHVFTAATLANCSFVSFYYGCRSAAALNTLLKEWQQGALPNLNVIEHRGYTKDKLFMETLLEHLGASDWDSDREQFFDIENFYKYAKLTSRPGSQRFRNGKDIIRRADGIQATIVPCGSPKETKAVADFVFVVWNNWIPQEYLRPSAL